MLYKILKLDVKDNIKIKKKNVGQVLFKMSISFPNMTTYMYPQDNNRNLTENLCLLPFLGLLSVALRYTSFLDGPLPKLCAMTLHAQLPFIQYGQQMFW